MQQRFLCALVASLLAYGCGGSPNPVSETGEGGTGSSSGSSEGTGDAGSGSGSSGGGTGSSSGSGGGGGGASSGGGSGSSSGGGAGGLGVDAGKQGDAGGAEGGSSGTCKSGKATTTELQACQSDGDCVCGQACVANPAFADNPTTTACETVCTSNSNCPNAASLCGGALGAGGGKTCRVNLCTSTTTSTDALVGVACDSSGAGKMDGTCVPQDNGTGANMVVCLPNGTATACSPSGDDDPWTTTNFDSSGMTSLYIESPQPRTASSFCGAGKGCQVPYDATSGTCDALCSPDLTTNHCPSSQICLSQDTYVWWGFCGACRAKSQPCNVATDCCSNSCNFAGGSVCD